MRRILIVLVVIVAFWIGAAVSQQPSTKVWVFLKGKQCQSAAADPLELSARRRRLNIQRDEMDVPVCQEYVDELSGLGKIRIVSRWLNAVSMEVEDQDALEKLHFVQSIEPVQSFKRDYSKFDLEEISSSGYRVQHHSKRSLNHGDHEATLEQINVPHMHNLGYTGKNVTIMVVDSGFYLNHHTISSIDVIDTWDFVKNDSNVGPESGDHRNQHYHGTRVLGLLAANQAPYYGVAYESRYLLAKTEDLETENTSDEDRLVAALEWGERRGADLASISLGYDFYNRVDGETAVSTRGVNAAIQKGMIVVVAVGNSGHSKSKTLGSPADAFKVISVGSVDAGGSLSTFSSAGPTSDDRIKPEVCGPGSNVQVIDPTSSTAYNKGSGTSFACPLVAGVTALLIQHQPNITPEEARARLMSTGNHRDKPNNKYGYGLIDAKSLILDCDSTCQNGFCSNNICECYSGYDGKYCVSDAAHLVPSIGAIVIASLLIILQLFT